MPVVNLTHTYVTGLTAKPPPERLEVWDAKTPGLCLRMGTNGSGTWSFRYRPKVGGGYQRVTLGRLADLTLADARERAARHRVTVADGGDPQRELKARKSAADSILTFGVLADRYIEEYAKPRKSSWKNDEGYLRRACGAWGKRAASSITRRDAINFLDGIKKVAPVSANRTQTVLVTFFNWSVEEGHLEVNPIAGLRKRSVEVAKDRVLSDREVRVLWTALARSEGMSRDVADALRFLLLTGQRPGEVAGILQSELYELDRPGEARWEIPAERMKARRLHVVPLPPSALQILQEAIERRRMDGDRLRVFSSRFVARDTLARHSLSQAMRRLIANLEQEERDGDAVASLQEKPPTPHDFRRTVGTGLARLKVVREDRKAVLAHVEDDVHGRHYDLYERLAEKRAALEAWDRHVGSVVGRQA
ncbi:tyrosine-type recombinase/integrase [Methylobacterium sp. J-070]|uniref:tyrosine-type recombinase/integrase n=1 Tax=Methylobacterium sp. J-070 TaxID=2836650 RepID=UPI001FBB8B77|nr:site-specific integrase [Methylobacterium sp. J-070]MCJ2051264.1 site-specific integrase [Methylobacterium sp. J-070]